MLNYGVLSKNHLHFRNFSGLEVSEFGTLKYPITTRYPAFEEKRLQRKERKRAVGAGHPFVLSLTDRLLMLLIYYHMYPSSPLLGYLFGLSQTSVLKSIKKLEPLVSEVLPLPKKSMTRLGGCSQLMKSKCCFPVSRLFWMQQNRRSRDLTASVNVRLITAARINGTP